VRLVRCVTFSKCVSACCKTDSLRAYIFQFLGNGFLIAVSPFYPFTYIFSRVYSKASLYDHSLYSHASLSFKSKGVYGPFLLFLHLSSFSALM
jgi:hypothetical protein